MPRTPLRRYLLPTAEKDEPRFVGEVVRLSVIGVRVIAGTCIGAPLAMAVMGLLWLPSYANAGWTGLGADLSFVAMGLAFLGLSFVPGMGPHARKLGLAAGFLVAFLQTVSLETSRQFLSESFHSTP